MGTSHQLIVAGHSIYSVKYEVEPWLLSIFRESDKKIFERKSSEAIGWIHEGDDYVETAYVYSSTVGIIKKRLDIMGISLGHVRDEFNNVVSIYIENTENKRARRIDLPEIYLFDNFDFDDWVNALKIASMSDYHPNTSFPNSYLELVEYLNPSRYSILAGMPFNDALSSLRFYLEAWDDENALVYLDITYLVHNDFYYPNEEVCNNALQVLQEEYSSFQKIIVLTEGSIDSVVLEKSLRILYPHLHEYYSFMDFGNANASGGASTLVANLKAFIGSGIANRVVALFDNDTAARVAMKGLRDINIPTNFKILQYPDLEFARSYPCFGPTGESKVDINGLACSIELYLGVDALCVGGKEQPIQWKGYDESIRQYQGEIQNKKLIQKAFFDKLEKCNSDRSLIEKTDWESLKLIFQKIFDAFA